MSERCATEAARLVEAIRPLLAGKPAAIQGAALADLLAIWLAGHVIDGEPAATKAMRAELLTNHVKAVLRLVPANEAEFGP